MVAMSTARYALGPAMKCYGHARKATMSETLYSGKCNINVVLAPYVLLDLSDCFNLQICWQCLTIS